MTIEKIQTAAVGELLKVYAAAAAAHGEATVSGDHRTSNRHHDIIAAVYRELRARGPEAQHLLLGLLDHPDVAVRGWTAAHALEFAPDEGEPVLDSIAKDSGISSLIAQTTLDEWKKGVLKFP